MAPPSEEVYHNAVYRRRYGQTRVNDIRGSPNSIACCGCVLFIFSTILFIIGLLLTILGYVNESSEVHWKLFRIMGPIALGLFALLFPLSIFTFKAAKIQAARWKEAQEQGKPPEAAYVTVDQYGTKVIRGTPEGIMNCAKVMIFVGIVFVLIGIPLIIVGGIKFDSDKPMPWVYLIIWGPLLTVGSIGFFLGGWAISRCSKEQAERLKHPEEYTAELRPRGNQVSTVSGSVQAPAHGMRYEQEKTQYGGGFSYQ